MWSSLPSNLRAVLGAALLLGIGVAAAAFTLSFFALRAAAEDPALKFGAGHSWLFPLGIDMALIFFEVLLLGASMVRVEERGRLVPYPRAVPFLLLMVAAGATLWFNTMRVPAAVRPVALAVPVASILVTLGLAYLLKMLAAASGADVVHLAPPTQAPNRIVRGADVIDGELVRADAPPDASLQVTRRQDPQNGHDESTRARIEAYLATMSPAQLAQATRASVTEVLHAQGVVVSEQYVGQVLGKWRAPLTRGRGRR